jgi:hypothetical protein
VTKKIEREVMYVKEEVKRSFVFTREELGHLLGIKGEITDWSLQERGKTPAEDRIKFSVVEMR